MHRLQDQHLKHENMIEGGRPPFERSARDTAASSAGRNISKSTSALTRSRSSPLAESSRNRSSTSKNPGIRFVMSAPQSRPHAVNPLVTDSARVFGGAQLRSSDSYLISWVPLQHR